MLKINKLRNISQGIFSLLAKSSSAPLQRFSQAQQLQGTINLTNLQNKPLIDQKINKKHYDVAVIGGGSGGLAFALEAAKYNLKTIVFDYVDPSTQGNTWGLGGTCVNVGCIPKKLMHTSGLYKEVLLNSPGYGFDIECLNEGKLDNKHFVWDNLVQNVQTYIKSINFGYKKTLKDKNIDYLNAFATFHDKNTLVFSPKAQYINKYLSDNNTINQENLGQITADKVVIAVGGRPQLLSDEQCKNSYKYGITSDDIFMKKSPPGKTLVVGGGYIAVECAGFLSTLGYDTSMMTRQIYLRDFDQDIAERIIENLQKENSVKVIPTSLPQFIEKVDDNQLKVKIVNQVTKQESEDLFNTVLFAIGRTANTAKLNLEKIGVQTNKKNKKVKGSYNKDLEQTSVENIYAIGDVLDGMPELTPIAQKQGQLLAKRLSIQKDNKEKVNTVYFEKLKMDINDFPTTVFTPTEYSCTGLSEENAIKQYGEENIEVYHSKYTPLEEQLSPRYDEDYNPIQRKAYAKIICNKKENEKVVGIHYLGPNAGEVMQGYAVAMKLGMTKYDLDRTVGIHPTTSEEFTGLQVTKRSGESYEKTSC